MRISIHSVGLLCVLASTIRLALSAVQIYDDRDLNVRYIKGDWIGRGVDAEYRGTTSESTTPGDTAVFSFTGMPILSGAAPR